MKLIISIFIFIAGCSQDVSILKIDEKQQDTSSHEDNVLNDTDEDATLDNDTSGYNPDHSLVVGFIEYSFIQASCPQCFGMSSEITTTQYARFHQPTGANHYSWVPREDEVCRQYYDSPVTISNIDVGETISLVAGSYVHNLSKSYDSTGVIYSGQIQNTDTNYVRDADYDTIIDGMAITDEKFTSLHGFDYIEPYAMLYTDPSYAYQAEIIRQTMFLHGVLQEIAIVFLQYMCLYILMTGQVTTVLLSVVAKIQDI